MIDTVFLFLSATLLDKHLAPDGRAAQDKIYEWEGR